MEKNIQESEAFYQYNIKKQIEKIHQKILRLIENNPDLATLKALDRVLIDLEMHYVNHPLLNLLSDTKRNK